ncbi:unnamed protein product [Hydatigera taeniaeformis]|uniref:MSC domain-containing protein n=1 Tax=Hydatigena taeniaeformis TaxID=6205 RepID=A0A0R3X7P5_HYDTA|nr:unnamed protein product [Hydatigera taeniaeformis]
MLTDSLKPEYYRNKGRPPLTGLSDHYQHCHFFGSTTNGNAAISTTTEDLLLMDTNSSTTGFLRQASLSSASLLGDLNGKPLFYMPALSADVDPLLPVSESSSKSSPSSCSDASLIAPTNSVPDTASTSLSPQLNLVGRLVIGEFFTCITFIDDILDFEERSSRLRHLREGVVTMCSLVVQRFGLQDLSKVTVSSRRSTKSKHRRNQTNNSSLSSPQSPSPPKPPKSSTPEKFLPKVCSTTSSSKVEEVEEEKATVTVTVDAIPVIKVSDSSDTNNAVLENGNEEVDDDEGGFIMVTTKKRNRQARSAAKANNASGHRFTRPQHPALLSPLPPTPLPPRKLLSPLQSNKATSKAGQLYAQRMDKFHKNSGLDFSTYASLVLLVVVVGAIALRTSHLTLTTHLVDTQALPLFPVAKTSEEVVVRTAEVCESPSVFSLLLPHPPPPSPLPHTSFLSLPSIASSFADPVGLSFYESGLSSSPSSYLYLSSLFLIAVASIW